MRPDKYKRRQQAPRADDRLRLQIAQEAARRLLPKLAPESGSFPLREASEAEFYAAKRKAAAVLGRRVRPGDLPSDHEVRQAVVSLARDRQESDRAGASRPEIAPEPEPDSPPLRLSELLDRFELYRLRLEPLAEVKQRARSHPEGDALYHSLQVFELARAERPFDEEFLLAALLHDVGKAIDPTDHIAAGLEALDGSISERTRWLIAHHREARAAIDAAPAGRARRVPGLDANPQDLEDLLLLGRIDREGRVPGTPVPSVGEALGYLRGLEDEAYLDGLGP
ncbi:HD domain-containing protein [Tautonia sociabilis]|uniref:HD domain-containing protein n=1 Tax=Tautonia sociabilis TaxID=2080755 RepID=A0A432MHZ5_9BACT|nr:HD domain-containing protein [Tautonia sociabilis]RUL86949.1 HD domain-containing protein [Tautonia sociabilis]